MEKLHILNPAPRAWPDKVYLTEKGQILQTHLSCPVNTGNVSGLFIRNSETARAQKGRDR